MEIEVKKNNKMEMNKIYCMDCIEGMRRFVPDKSVDIVVTSPPYNI